MNFGFVSNIGLSGSGLTGAGWGHRKGKQFGFPGHHLEASQQTTVPHQDVWAVCKVLPPLVPALMHFGGGKQIFLLDAPTLPIWG